MKKLKLCNVHKLAFANEGEGRKPIHIPFGTWAYDDTIDQTLDREHAEKIAADLAGARKRTTPHGCGWPLKLAEYLCGEYGWSWRKALATPVATAFALSAASRQRHGAPPGGLDYIERISQDAVKAKKKRHQT